MQQVNGSPSGRIARSEVLRPEVVVHERSDQVKGSTNLGVFWPSWLFLQKVGSAPPTADLTVYEGEPGVIRDDSHGVPVGATRLEKVHTSSVKKTKELVSNATAQREGQLQSMHRLAVKRLDVSVRKDSAHFGGDGKVRLDLKAAPVARRGEDIDFLTEIDVPFKLPKKTQPQRSEETRDGSGGGDVASTPQSKIARGGGGSGGGGPPKRQKNRSRSGRREREPTSGSKASSTKQTLEHHAGEQVLIEIKQVLGMAGSNRDFNGISTAKVLSLQKKLAQRLKNESVEVALRCDDDQDGRDRATKGQALVSELRQYSAQVDSLARYMSLAAPNKKAPEAMADARSLHMALSDCEASGLVMAPKVKEKLLRAHAVSLVERAAYEDFMVAFVPTDLAEKTASTGTDISIHMISVDQRQRVQQELLHDMLHRMLRVADSSAEGKQHPLPLLAKKRTHQRANRARRPLVPPHFNVAGEAPEPANANMRFFRSRKRTPAVLTSTLKCGGSGVVTRSAGLVNVRFFRRGRTPGPAFVPGSKALSMAVGPWLCPRLFRWAAAQAGKWASE